MSGCGVLMDSADAKECRAAVDKSFTPEEIREQYPDMPEELIEGMADDVNGMRDLKALDWADCMTRRDYTCNAQIDGESATVPEVREFMQSEDFDLERLGPATHCGGEGSSIPNPFVGKGWD